MTGLWNRTTDYRARAAGGVALAALALLLPFVAVSALQGRHAMAAGTAVVVAMLAANVWLVARGRDHQRVLLWGFLPIGMAFLSYVFLVDGIVGSVWCFPTIIACHCMLNLRRAIWATVIVLAFAVPMIWLTVEPALAARFCATLTAVSLFAHILVREIDAQQARLRFQIDHDPLTGLLNRTSLKARLEATLEARRRDGTPAALLSIDLDHFKSINDRFGHETGDLVLCEVARLLRSRVRAEDAVFRMGGEEFLVLLVGTRPAGARAKAEALRGTLESAAILQHRPVTASVGVATLRRDDERGSWMRRVDERLYAAKRTGRNRVVAVDETAPPAPATAEVVELASRL